MRSEEWFDKGPWLVYNILDRIRRGRRNPTVIDNPTSDSQEEIERFMRDRGKEQPAEQAEVEGVRSEQPPIEQPAPLEARVYVVQQGESLSEIAKTAYGDATRWREIYEANKDKIKDPKIIQPGQELVIP
jgi:nucleoid-associated protein YgaU